MSRAVIVCGSDINEYGFVAECFRDDDFFVYCDCGLKHIEGFRRVADCRDICRENKGEICEKSSDFSENFLAAPDLIIGDFDSYEKPETSVETIVLPREKDDTDSVYAIKECIKRGFDEVLLVGVIGRRLDHSLVNVYALKMLHDEKIKATIVDDYGFISLIGPKEEAFIEPVYKYFSLLTIESEARISIENAKYNLNNGKITSSYQYATSNEVAGDVPARVYVEEGYVLLIKIVRE